MAIRWKRASKETGLASICVSNALRDWQLWDGDVKVGSIINPAYHLTGDRPNEWIVSVFFHNPWCRWMLKRRFSDAEIEQAKAACKDLYSRQRTEVLNGDAVMDDTQPWSMPTRPHARS
jgi:hypothetical protein